MLADDRWRSGAPALHIRGPAPPGGQEGVEHLGHRVAGELALDRLGQLVASWASQRCTAVSCAARRCQKRPPGAGGPSSRPAGRGRARRGAPWMPADCSANQAPRPGRRRRAPPRGPPAAASGRPARRRPRAPGSVVEAAEVAGQVADRPARAGRHGAVRRRARSRLRGMPRRRPAARRARSLYAIAVNPAHAPAPWLPLGLGLGLTRAPTLAPHTHPPSWAAPRLAPAR